MANDRLSDCPGSVPKGSGGSRRLGISFPGPFQLLGPPPLSSPDFSGHILEREKEEGTVLAAKSGR